MQLGSRPREGSGGAQLTCAGTGQERGSGVPRAPPNSGSPAWLMGVSYVLPVFSGFLYMQIKLPRAHTGGNVSKSGVWQRRQPTGVPCSELAFCKTLMWLNVWPAGGVLKARRTRARPGLSPAICCGRHPGAPGGSSVALPGRGRVRGHGGSNYQRGAVLSTSR